MKLLGLVSNFFIHVSVSNLHIATIGPPDRSNIQGGIDKSGILKILFKNLTAQLKIIRFY
jgi:hypothetical protein